MVIWLLSVLIGCVAGFLTPAAWWAIQQGIGWISGQGDAGTSTAMYLGLPLSVAAGVFLLFVGFKGFRSADGFTYFISDLHFQDGRRKIRYSFLHGIANLLFLFGRGVVGIEGFCMEFLSAIGSWLGQKARLSANQVRTLAACGATAGIASVLGQPTAAFLFVVELLYGWGSMSFAVGTYALTAFVAASVSQSLTAPNGWFDSVFATDAGLSSAFRADSVVLTPEAAVFAVVAVSVSAGLLAAFTIWIHRRTDKELHQLFGAKKSSDISPAAFALRLGIWVAVTMIAIYRYPQVLGSGAQLLQEVLSQGTVFWVTLLALLLRILLGALAYSVLGSMGLILPTLVVGGLLGSCLFHLAQGFVPVGSGALGLLALGGFFSAAFGTPVAATALVFGYSTGLMTDSALFLFTALLTNFSAHYLCGLLQTDRMASMGLYRHGIRFRSGMCYNTLSGIQVRDAMITYVNPVSIQSSIGEAYKRLMESKFSTLPVIDGEGKMKGVVALSDFYGLDTWKRLGEESQVHSLVGVEEMLKPARVKLGPDMNLETALENMSDEDLAPVSEENGVYVGLLVKSDLVNLYNKEVVKKTFRRR